MLNNLTTILIAILPFAFAWLAMTLYGVLSQEHWSNTAKEMLADGFVIVAALGCAVATTSLTCDLAVFLAPIVAIGTYYFAKESTLLKQWSTILQEGFLVIQDGKVYLFGVQVPSHIQITQPETPIVPVPTIGQPTVPLNQVEASGNDSTHT